MKIRFMRLNNENGFTLMDTVMVIGILPFLFAALLSTTQAAGTSMRTQSVIQTLNHDGMQMLRSITRELSQSDPIASDGQLVVTDGATYDQVRFRVPIDWDGDGDVTGSSEDVFEWGATAPCNTTIGVTPCAVVPTNWAKWQNYWIQYRVSGTTLYREVLDTSLTLVTGYQFAIAKNINSFAVTQTGNLITVTVSFTEQDKAGERGQSRSFSQSYVLTTQTMMRNVVDAE